MVIQCCVCRKVRQDTRWVEVSLPTEPGLRISHGYCPECAARALEEIREVVSRRQVLSPAA